MQEVKRVSMADFADMLLSGVPAKDIPMPGDIVEDEVPDEDEEGDEQDDTCWPCRGTGIGMFGDPDTSRCHWCHGSGVMRHKDRDDDDDYGDRRYDEMRDRKLEEEYEKSALSKLKDEKGK